LRIKRLAFALARSLALPLLVALFGALCFSPLGAAQGMTTPAVGRPAAIHFWNRTIATQRGMLAGSGPAQRAERAEKTLAELPLNTSVSDIETKAVRIDNQDGAAFIHQGKVLFFLGTNDLDQEANETLDEATRSAMVTLGAALQARASERTWPVIRNGILYSVIGFVVLLVLIGMVWSFQSALVRFLQKREGVGSLRLFRLDLLPHLFVTLYTLIRVIAWFLTFGLVYAWITFSLRRFPYTEPWGRQAGGYLLNALLGMGNAVLHSLPDLLVVVLIFLLSRWLVRMMNLFFDPIASGRLTVSWMDADVARATQRIVSTVLWIFAIIFAYPYIPGSQTEAFKGLSVFLGLVISLGSTGVINQIMSGLFVVYSKALRTGEWVKVNDIEGIVLEVGLLAVKVRTIERQEVTIPHSVLVSSSTKNFTRLGHPDGMTISPSVTIGYDAPWRQVHALLELAAERTVNIRREPAPYVVQRQLSDFYVEYTLVAHLENEGLRVSTISSLNSAIQDAFNEASVQIMSPHYMVQPDGAVVVPPGKWNPPPAGNRVEQK
jgi:small-conductance mechanosensitive channel